MDSIYILSEIFLSPYNIHSTWFAQEVPQTPVTKNSQISKDPQTVKYKINVTCLTYINFQIFFLHLKFLSCVRNVEEEKKTNSLKM